MVGILGAAGDRLLFPVEANELFVRMSAVERAMLRAQGFGLYDWGPDAARFVTAWNSDADHVRALARAMKPFVVRTGIEGCTASMFTSRVSGVIPMKSFSASYGIFS